MIVDYGCGLRYRIERLEAERLPKPQVIYYFEALDENGELWNIAHADWQRFSPSNEISLRETGPATIASCPLLDSTPVRPGLRSLPISRSLG